LVNVQFEDDTLALDGSKTARELADRLLDALPDASTATTTLQSVDAKLTVSDVRPVLGAAPSPPRSAKKSNSGAIGGGIAAAAVVLAVVVAFAVYKHRKQTQGIGFRDLVHTQEGDYMAMAHDDAFVPPNTTTFSAFTENGLGPRTMSIDEGDL